MSSPVFKGIIPPVPTLFDETETFDKVAMGKLIDHLIDTDVDGLFFLGSVAEFAHMSDQLRLDVSQFCIEHGNNRKPVLIGVAHPGTQATIDFAHAAQKMGADGVVIINPYYNPLSDEALYGHFSHIAENVELPIILYNFPALTGQSIPVNIVSELAMNHKNIVGIKDTVDTLNHIREVIHAVKPNRPDFAVFAGYDEYLFGTLILGGDGAIPASANFASELTCGIYKSWQKQDLTEVVKLQQRLSYIPALYGAELPFYNVIKCAIKAIGLDIPVHSLKPTRELNEGTAKLVKEALIKSEIIK